MNMEKRAGCGANDQRDKHTPQSGCALRWLANCCCRRPIDLIRHQMTSTPEHRRRRRYRGFGHEPGATNSSLGTATAGGRSFLFNPLGRVPRHGNRAYHLSVDIVLDEGERHLDVELASGLVRRAGQRWAAL
jgi:hypothetical protein